MHCSLGVPGIRELEIMRGPQKITKVFLLITVFSSIFLDFWSYSKAYYLDPAVYTDVLLGTAPAPNQYRVGVIRLADFMSRRLHFGLRHGMTLLDLVSVVVALLVLLSVLQRSAIYRNASNISQWLSCAVLVVLVQFYLAWITWYQRPETLPSAALVAISLGLLSWRPPLGRSAATVTIALCTFAVVFAQSLVRADIAFTLHLGILLVCLTPAGKGVSLPRGTQAVISLLAVLLAGGVQFYMMHVAYPYANYGDTPVFQLKLNITDRLRVVPFVLFLVPYAWSVVKVFSRRFQVEAASLGLLAGSLLFIPLWCVVGKIDEVRIFLPFTLALAPLTALLLMQAASPHKDELNSLP